MPYVMIKDEDFRKLKELAGIFEVPDVISKILDEYLENYTAPDYIAKDEETKVYTFDDVPSLSHAKFISGHLDFFAFQGRCGGLKPSGSGLAWGFGV